MITFMDYIVHAFGTSTGWNHDNSYSSLTATSDALLSFPTPSTLSFHVSSLSTPYFATSYTLSTLGQIDGSISYLYCTVPLNGVPSRAPHVPLRTVVRGYRDVRLPAAALDPAPVPVNEVNGRKPTLLHATLALPPPSTLTALYARRLNAETLLSVSLHSRSISSSTNSGPPPAAVLAHIQRDTGRYSVEGLGSTDHALLGLRGLYNFGLNPPKLEDNATTSPRSVLEAVDGLTDLSTPVSKRSSSIDTLAAHRASLAMKPSLLSAGGEFYYSPTSHVIGLSTGLRFTTLAPHVGPPQQSSSSSRPLAGASAAFSSALLNPANIPHSSFPYTMTLTATPLTGSLSSSYSVQPTSNLALSSRFDFNVYSWESRYTVGAEIWRRRRRSRSQADAESDDSIAWARQKLTGWFSEDELQVKRDRLEREEENVLKLRVDDAWNVRALWTGRVKDLLVSAGVSVSPVKEKILAPGGPVINLAGEEGRQRWSGTFGIEIAYST